MKEYQIINSKKKDIDEIMAILKDAKAFLKSYGSSQWQDSYPKKELILDDIKKKNHYSCFYEGNLVGIMTITTYDENYDVVYNGSFSNNNYYAIHRIAVKAEYRNHGIAKKLLAFAENLAISNDIHSIRIDTHQVNIPMQRLLLSASYSYVGIIHLKENQDDYVRLAYEKIF
ncbi:GNAT family N-acetyltransferase [Acholeplasma sp. OttesenSCG-928-E16]|nr:GNAT family N-acetyltransferase [Acholeplasma sp. OttesenSCG-928-E16]